MLAGRSIKRIVWGRFLGKCRFVARREMLAGRSIKRIVWGRFLGKCRFVARREMLAGRSIERIVWGRELWSGCLKKILYEFYIVSLRSPLVGDSTLLEKLAFYFFV
jgi:hypothetical protein